MGIGAVQVIEAAKNSLPVLVAEGGDADRGWRVLQNGQKWVFTVWDGEAGNSAGRYMPVFDVDVATKAVKTLPFSEAHLSDMLQWVRSRG